VNAQLDLLAADTLTTLADYDAILNTAQGLDYATKQMDLHLQYGTVQTASNTLQNLTAYTTVAANEQSILNDYTRLYTTLLNVKQRNGTIDSLSLTELDSLKAIAGNGNAAQAEARSLLEYYTEERIYNEPLPVWSDASAQRKAKVVKTTKKQPIITVFPNPAKEFITIEWQNATENGGLEIFNVKGELVKNIAIQKDCYSQTFSVADWASGAYLYRYTASSAPIQQGKFEVIK
jgi:hypothetical protein